MLNDISYFKDWLYLLGSILGIIGFIRTLQKRDKCMFNYRTEFGDEVHPFLVCIRGEIYNLEISSSKESFEALKLPIKTNLSRFKYKELNEKEIDTSSFFPIIKETEIICIPNEKLNLPLIYLKYEDIYQNRYFQTFSFDNSEVGNLERVRRKSRSCYKISRRHFKFLWIWF
jgi:hypothetical protein